MGRDTSRVRALFDSFVIANYTRAPIVLDQGSGSHVWDIEGKEYLDLFPGWAVCGLGHCHPRVVDAIRLQAEKLIHVPNTFYIENQGKLAGRIVQYSFAGKCFFCNSGAEAVEAAIKVARLQRKGRYKIIAMDGSFHGRTFGALSATGQTVYQQGLEPLLPGFVHVPFNDLDAVRGALDKETCAVLLEPVQGEGGVRIASREFMGGIRKLCDRHGLLMMVDEVQTGIARTGKWFAYQHYGIEPDVMCLAKSLGGGVAIGAIVATDEAAVRLTPGTHASTFGGNPLATAAALAVFDAVEQENLVENAREMGDHMASRFEETASRMECITEVRHLGLMLGAQLNVECKAIVEECARRGVLINCTQKNVLRIIPACTVTREDLDPGLDTVFEVIGEFSS